MFLFFLYCSQLSQSEHLTFWASAKEYKCLKEGPGSGWRVSEQCMVWSVSLNWGIPLIVTSVLHRLAVRNSTNHGSLTILDDNWFTHSWKFLFLTHFVVALLNFRLSAQLALWRLNFSEGIFNNSECKLFISWICWKYLNRLLNLFSLISVYTAEITKKEKQITELKEDIKKGKEELAGLQKQNESNKKSYDVWV